MKNDALWKKIQAFQFDDPTAGFSFSDRLASENGWKADFTLRVIEEYRRFLYLCCVADFSITPSREVDEAWHLHLCYTKSYWEDLCSHTLDRKIHHGPTKGGRFERAKFIDWYDDTKKTYRREFDQAPPEDIWPSSELRFSSEALRKIDSKKYLILPKRPLLIGAALLGTALILPSCSTGGNNGLAIILTVILSIILILLAFITRGGGGGGSGGGSGNNGGSFFGGGDCSNNSGCGGGGCGGGGCGGGGCGGN